MSHEDTSARRPRRRPRGLGLALLAAVVVAAPAGAGALSVDASLAAAAPNTPYTLHAQALLGPDGTDLYLTPASTSLPDPTVLDKVQVKAATPDGKLLRTENRFDIPVEDGVATIHLDGLHRLDAIDVNAHAKAPDGAPAIPSQNNIAADTRVLKRPDLTVKVSLPQRITRRHEFTVAATVTEINGDVGAAASVGVFDGSQPAAGVPQRVTVAPGGTATVPVTVRLEKAGRHALRTEVSGASPGEWSDANNVDVEAPLVSMYTADGAVASQSRLATEEGIKVLQSGGNAIDAAAAVAFVLNVTQPHLTGIGGGSGILVHLASGGDFALDARETAPAAATADMFANAPAGLATSGASVGVPGTLAAIDLMLRRWGTKSLSQAIQPALHLARDGAPASVAFARACRNNLGLARRPGLRDFCLRADGTPIQAGDTVVMRDLATTFGLIASQGADTFYRPDGDIAKAIAAAVRQPQFGPVGRIEPSDVGDFAVDVRAPIFRDYHGARIVTVPPSSSGGLGVLQMLGLVDRFPMGSPGWEFGSVNAMNVEIEAIRLELADRARWMGDDRPPFPAVPERGLLSPDYVAARSALIDPAKRMPAPVAPGDPLASQPTAPPIEFSSDPDDPETTHFSVVDKDGNAVAFSTTLQGTWGSAIVVPGFGFVLNDSLVLFNRTPKKDVPPGNQGFNDAAPGKRPMGNLTPTMIFGGGEPIVVSGTPGGVFIPQAMFQVIVDIVDHHMSVEDAVKAPRFWLGPDPENFVDMNAGFHPETIDALRRLGQIIPIGRGPFIGSNFVQSIEVDPATVDLSAVPDMRAEDSFASLLAP